MYTFGVIFLDLPIKTVLMFYIWPESFMSVQKAVLMNR